MAPSGHTIADTGGCSAYQIVGRLGLGGGQRRFGIPHGILLRAVSTSGS